MRIELKTILAFLSVVLVFVIGGFAASHAARIWMQESILHETAMVTAGSMKSMDASVHTEIDGLRRLTRDLDVQEALAESNDEFGRLDDIQAHVEQVSRSWISAESDELLPLTRELIGNRLSCNLRTRTEGTAEGRGHYREILVTNRYGANVAQTGITADYSHADETWWQEAKRSGAFVARLQYDQSADLQGLPVAVRVDDRDGEFLGVLKAVLSPEALVAPLRQAGDFPWQESAEFMLVGPNGELVYTSEQRENAADPPGETPVPPLEGMQTLAGRGTGIKVVYGLIGPKRGFAQVSHEIGSHSPVHGGGPGWSLRVERDLARAFAPVERLQRTMLLISVAATVLAVIVGVALSGRIPRSLSQIAAAAEEIGGGNLDCRVDIRSNDEIGALASAFNRMGADLKRITASKDALEREITQRKRAEEALAQAASQWQETFDAVDDMIAVIDTDFRVLRANRAMREAFAGKEVVGAYCYALFHDTGRPPAGCPSCKTFASGGPAHAELFEPNMDGRWLGVAAYPVEGKDGTVRQLVHVVHDITERKVAEEQLQDYAKRLELLNADLERSNSDLQEFTHSVSHDLQEPLRKIHAFGQFLVEDCGESIPEEGRKHLERIQDATVRMKRLIQHLLNLARVGSRGAEIVPVDSRAVMEQAVDVLSERVAECGAQLTVADGLPVVMADAVQLGQVFQNLIANALKFRSPDRPPRVTIVAEVAGSQATFSVTDNGIGIEERFLEKIFGIFQRLHLREEYDGAGVGLALCRKIVQRHGGTIWAESEPGKGSTFHFTLPAAAETEGEKP